jgi:predicted MFS family arabinose efflux permease
VVAVACALSAVLVVFCALAQSLSGLALARFASGLTVAMIVPLGLAFVGDAVPDGIRQEVLARFMSGQILGQLFGQAAGGIISDWIGWRGIFVVLALAFAIVAAALGWQLRNRPLDVPAAKAAPRSFWAGYGAVFGNPWARIVLLGVFLEGFFSFGVFAFVGSDLNSRLGLSLSSVGAIVALFAVGGRLYGAMARALLKLFCPVKLVVCGGSLIGCGFLVLAVQTQWWSAPAAVTAIGVGFYMLHSVLLTNATQMCPRVRATAVATFGGSLYLGQTAGVALSGAVVDGFGAQAIFLAAGVFMPVTAAWFAFRLHRRFCINVPESRSRTPLPVAELAQQ